MKWKLVFQIIKHCKCLIADEYVWKHVFVLNLFASIVDVELYAYFHTIYDGFFLYIYWMVFWMSRFSMQLQKAYTDLKKKEKMNGHSYIATTRLNNVFIVLLVFVIPP